MKIAFVSPPQLNIAPLEDYHPDRKFIIAEDCCWGPVGSQELPAMLLACASQVEDGVFIDLSIDDPQAVVDAHPDMVVYPLESLYYREMYPKLSCVLPAIPHVVLAVPPGYMEDYAKLTPTPWCVVYSEPELVFSTLKGITTDHLEDWRREAPGIAYLRNGVYYQHKPLPNCLDHIENTNFDLVPETYWAKYRVVCYQVTRGCPYRCHFCVWGGSTVTDATFKMRPAKQVADAIRSIQKKTNHLRALYILSSQLTTNLQWIQEFHSYMHENPLSFQTNVNHYDLTDEKIRLLKESGMRWVSVGTEALSDSLLQKMGKQHRFSHIVNGSLILDKYYDRYSSHLKYGCGETEEDIEETLTNLQKLKEAGVTNARYTVGPLLYYKGTYIREHPPCETIPHPKYGEPMMKVSKSWNKVGNRLKEYGWL